MMKPHLRTFAPAIALALASVACQSSTTTPTASVTFLAPVASSPATASTYKYAQQPITLAITNATAVSSATTTYSIEVASDSAFATKVFTKDGIAEGSGGTTAVTLSVLDGEKTYYWRWRATVAGTAGEYTAARNFSVGPRVVVSKPVLASPGLGDEFFVDPPALVTNNAARVGPVTTMQYTFQLSTSSSFATILQQANVNEQSGGKTSWTPTISLPEAPYFWRVRATDLGTGETSPFSDSLRFEQKEGIDLKKVIVSLGAVGYPNWPQTRRLTYAQKNGSVLCTESDGNFWPTTGFFGDPSVPIYGQQWNFVKIGAQWYAAAGHYLRDGQTCKGEMDEYYFPEGFLGREPFSSVRAYEGMPFGVGVSTPARLWPDMATRDERSNVVIITW